VKQKKIADPASISDAIPILRGILWRQFPVPSSYHEVKMLGRHGLMRNYKITESQNGRGWKGPLWVI